MHLSINLFPLKLRIFSLFLLRSQTIQLNCSHAVASAGYVLPLLTYITKPFIIQNITVNNIFRHKKLKTQVWKFISDVF